MNIVTKIILTFDIFYAIMLFLTVYLCMKYYDNDVDLFWENSDPIFTKILVRGILIILLQSIYFPVMFVITGHL
jgi:hypothetical protein